ncbi:hypothetical protein HWV62_42004 [Athelia sp. TMB]|nr:hypothetical protein HWV62_42004 [Athelia sp. TMB]
MSDSYTPASYVPFSPPNAPHEQKYVFLHGPTCLDPDTLEHVATGLKKGDGDLVFILAPFCDSEPGSQDLEEVLASMGLESKVPVSEKRWKKIADAVGDKEFTYHVIAASPSPELASAQDILVQSARIPYAESNLSLSHASALKGFAQASLRCVLAASLSVPTLQTLYVVERPAISFPPLTPSPSLPLSLGTADNAAPTTPYGVPTMDEWRSLWAAWDLVTLSMIHPEMLLQKPIDLRHKCLFYIGHIPTFLDMLMSKALDEPNTEPKNFTTIFESHSEVPEADEDWPTLDSILAFRDSVRARLARLYADLESGKRQISRQVARMLVMTHEHEGFHVERAGTGTLPPPGFTAPPWSALAAQWEESTPALASHRAIVGPATVILGQNDSEADDFRPDLMYDVNGHSFGWDNESPPRAVQVGKFSIDWRPVSNGEFYEFWKNAGAAEIDMPKSWVCVEGDIMVRTLYGPVSFEHAKQWPVLTAYDHLVAYATHRGGRLPSEPELRLFFDTYEVGHDGGANVGFRNWHPTPATTGGSEDDGRGSNGGVWEWTTSVFDGHEGLVPTDHFTGYSTDFFDGKHQIVRHD